MSGHKDRPAGRELQHRLRCCRHCRHWHAPAATLLAAFDAFRAGITKRPVKQPIGQCDRVLIAEGRPVSFSATAPGFTCLNFQADAAMSVPAHDGMVTVYEGERIIWQGNQEDLPDEYR